LLFSVLIGIDQLAPRRVYGSIVSISGKLTALREAFEVAAYEADADRRDRDTFRVLLEHYEKASNRRNEIAHGEAATLVGKKIRGCFLLPPSYYTKKTDLPWVASKKASGMGAFGSYAYTSEHINQFSKRFDELQWWANDFVVVWTLGYRPKKP
jgi:hypothetical protein